MISGFVLFAITTSFIVLIFDWDPLTPVWGQAVGLAFPPLITLSFTWYLWRYRNHKHRSLLYTYAGTGSVMGAIIFLTPGLGVVTQQATIGQPILNAEIFLLELWLGGGLIGVIAGHFYAVVREERIHLERLHDTTEKLILTAETADIADRTVTAAERIIGLDTSAIYVPRAETTLEPIAATERTADIFNGVPTIDSRDAIAWTVYDSGDSVFIDDVTDHPDTDNPETPVRSEMILPIGDIGVFLAASKRVGAFDKSDQMLAQVLISNAEAAFQRASRESTLREQERKLEALQERSERLMYTQTPEETAQAAVEAAEDVIGAPLTGVHLLNEDSDTLEGVAVSEAASERFSDSLCYSRNHEDGSSDAIIWGVFERGEPLYIEDTDEYDPLTEEPLSQCVLVYPVGDHGVFIASGDQPCSFDDTERTLFEILTSVLETALDRVEREQELRRSQSRLKQHRQRLTILNRVLRHDVRSTASVMFGAVSELRETLGDEPALNRFERQTDKIVELSENARRAQQTLRKSDTNSTIIRVIDTVESIIEDLKNTYPETEIRIETPDQAHAASNGLVDAAIENVLINAVEHNDSDSTEIDVAVSLDSGGEEVSIRIADNGPGIPAHEREVFKQGEETELKHSRGLGLWLVHWIIEDVGGTVEFEQRQPRGTIVELRIPQSKNPNVSDGL